jgi:hypothetical protein
MALPGYRLTLLAVMLALLLPATPASAEAPRTAPPGYQHAVARLPARHWALVRSVAVDRASNGQAGQADLSVHLPPADSNADGVLAHEVGHIVAYTHPDLERAWEQTFWPDGQPLGQTVSRYARTNPREDWAETYKELLERGHLDGSPERERFMRERVFLPGELSA